VAITVADAESPSALRPDRCEQRVTRVAYPSRPSELAGSSERIGVQEGEAEELETASEDGGRVQREGKATDEGASLNTRKGAEDTRWLLMYKPETKSTQFVWCQRTCCRDLLGG
jgi:hypothetical protein